VTRSEAVLLLLATAACASRPQPVITGFRGVPWGATEAEVVAGLGAPWRQVPRGETERFLAYPAVLLADHAAEPSVVIDRDSGMVQAGYLVRIRGFESRCEAAFESVAAVLLADFPSLQPGRTRRNDGNAPFCRAVLEGQAEAHLRLVDPANGAMLLAALEPGRDFMRVTYASPMAVRRAGSTPPQASNLTRPPR